MNRSLTSEFLSKNEVRLIIFTRMIDKSVRLTLRAISEKQASRQLQPVVRPLHFFNFFIIGRSIGIFMGSTPCPRNIPSNLTINSRASGFLFKSISFIKLSKPASARIDIKFSKNAAPTGFFSLDLSISCAKPPKYVMNAVYLAMSHVALVDFHNLYENTVYITVVIAITPVKIIISHSFIIIFSPDKNRSNGCELSGAANLLHPILALRLRPLHRPVSRPSFLKHPYLYLSDHEIVRKPFIA